MQEYLLKRVKKLEDCVKRLDQQTVDTELFFAALDSLIQDDEEAKTGFYAAFLEHLLVESTDVLPNASSC